MLEKLLYLGHHPVDGSSIASQAVSGSGPGISVWIIVAVFVLGLIGFIYWTRKKK